MTKLLVTDLDNTLYDWVTFYSKAFYAMLKELTIVLDVEEKQLISEFKIVHRKYGTSELPFATLELPTTQRKFKGSSRLEMAQQLQQAFLAFDASRSENLTLYPTVRCTLESLKSEGIKVVAHTEAYIVNVHSRLKRLRLSKLLQRVYAPKGITPDYPFPVRPKSLSLPDEFFIPMRPGENKPDPNVLLDICHFENVSPANTFYVGDSLTQDIWMARQAGVISIWAKYGTKYEKSSWEDLVRITHWSDEDVARSIRHKKQHGNILPDFTISSFREVLGIINNSCNESRAESQ